MHSVHKSMLVQEQLLQEFLVISSYYSRTIHTSYAQYSNTLARLLVASLASTQYAQYAYIMYVQRLYMMCTTSSKYYSSSTYVQQVYVNLVYELVLASTPSSCTMHSMHTIVICILLQSRSSTTSSQSIYTQYAYAYESMMLMFNRPPGSHPLSQLSIYILSQLVCIRARMDTMHSTCV